ncbi:MAG TPA: hypothetical protein VHB73_06610 [Alphaproteobacteria bacterium]|nr:hypothetical protein [Alphaproteobacteria bacterium]
MSRNNNSLILLLTAVVIILAGVIYWQQGTHDCEKRLGAFTATRFIPFAGCEVKIGDTWRSESQIKNSVQEGVREMQEGAKKTIEGIIGK